MINVLVVEDEPPILGNVSRSIEKAHSDFQVVATAFDGKEAQEILESGKYPLDVVVTDIHMPLMNGLELLDYIQATHPEIIPVVLSGYEDFSYAKSAFKAGVIDYLLKPLDRGALRTLLDRIADQVTGRREKNMTFLLDRALAGQVADLGEGELVIILLCAGPFPVSEYDYLLPGKDYWEKHNLEPLARRFAPGLDLWVLQGKSSVERLIVLRCNDETAERFAAQMLAYLGTLEALPLTLCRAPALSVISRLPEVHHNLRQSLHRGLAFGRPSSVPYLSYQEHSLRFSRAVDEAARDFRRVLTTAAGAADCGRCLTDGLSSLTDGGCGQRDLEQYLHYCFYSLIGTLPGPVSFSRADWALKGILTETYSRKALLDEVAELFNDLIRPRGDRDREKEALVERVKEYIALGYARPISNQTLSDVFGLGPSYISTLFKAETGISPSEFLLKMRMEKARELLESQGSLLTRDVAAQVGYSDPLYFSRVFKKYYGVNPRAVKG